MKQRGRERWKGISSVTKELGNGKRKQVKLVELEVRNDSVRRYGWAWEAKVHTICRVGRTGNVEGGGRGPLPIRVTNCLGLPGTEESLG